MDRKPKCVYACIRIDGMVRFQHVRIFFHLKFSVENIFHDRYHPRSPWLAFDETKELDTLVMKVQR